MTALTLPRAAVRYGNGPGYPMGGGIDSASLVAFTPLLPEGFSWRDSETPGCIPLDMKTVAELLFCSQIDPATASAEDAIAAVHAQLCACHCDLRDLAGLLGSEYGELPDTSPAHMARCLILAARLLAVTP